MQRFFLTNTAINPGQSLNLAALDHQLRAVLRLQAGDQITLLDDQGRAFLTELTALNRRYVAGLVLAQLPDPPEPALHLTLYQCSLKADKFEWILQKGTEVGVSTFVPVISQRSVVRPASALLKKYERWQSIVREAAEQCGRGRLPHLAQPLAWSEVVAQAQGVRLLPWEDLATSPAQPLRAALPSAATAVNLLIGPEGGIAPAEVEEAQSTGWQTVSLGPLILRAETAAIVSAALVMAQAF
ncbi:MAG: RsmE family RNA methyltransferase [Caldilineaceae bacterium]